ncbi:MAG: CPBP family intramembrane metalloprotease [Bacteroidia bacterium]|nr:CPBP family intramembrane metalloprotease [Bacteroidia bacterium]
MNNKIPKSTIMGLILAFFGGPLLLFIFNQITDDIQLTNTIVIIRESCLFILTGLLLVLIVKGEKLNLESIGLHNKHWGKSLVLALLITISSVVLLACIVGIFHLLGISYGEGSNRYDNVSMLVLSIIMVRAGVIEEISYRGFIIERLEKYTGNRLIYLYLPALIFGMLHYRQGLAGIVIATAAGLLLAFFYLKKRDLKANIIAHFLVDFIPNILVPLIAGAS